MQCRVFVLGSPTDMMKAVSSALDANYSGKAWLKWFTTTAKAVIAELDASSATDGVRRSTKFDLCRCHARVRYLPESAALGVAIVMTFIIHVTAAIAHRV